VLFCDHRARARFNLAQPFIRHVSMMPVSPTQKAAILHGKPVDRGLLLFTTRDPPAVVPQRQPAPAGAQGVTVA